MELCVTFTPPLLASRRIILARRRGAGADGCSCVIGAAASACEGWN